MEEWSSRREIERKVENGRLVATDWPNRPIAAKHMNGCGRRRPSNVNIAARLCEKRRTCVALLRVFPPAL